MAENYRTITFSPRLIAAVSGLFEEALGDAANAQDLLRSQLRELRVQGRQPN